MSEAKLLTLEEALAMLAGMGVRVSLSGLRLWLRQGKVESCRLGKRRYVPALALQNFLANSVKGLAV